MSKDKLTSSEARPPPPPFTRESAMQKIRMAENGWNSRDPQRTEDSQWRKRHEFLSGRAQIIEFLTRKWRQEHAYRLVKEIWSHDEHCIAVRFA